MSEEEELRDQPRQTVVVHAPARRGAKKKKKTI